MHCLALSCHEGECECVVESVKSQVHIVNMNCAKNAVNKRGRICDCGILWKTHPQFAVVELKGGTSNLPIKKLVEQLQGGLDLLDKQLADQIVEDFSRSSFIAE